MVHESIVQTLNEFKQASVAKNNLVATQKLNDLNEMILTFDSIPPMNLENEFSALEWKIAQEFYEHAVLYIAETGDRELLRKYLSTLRPIYAMKSSLRTDLTCVIVGISLLHLLVENDLAAFHSELELLTAEQLEHPAVEFCTRLDRHLMVGSYDQVLSAATHPPVPQYSFFLQSLMRTVRVIIGECAAASYPSLTLPAATKILMFQSTQETLDFINESYPGWTVIGGEIKFNSVTLKSEGIPSQKLISQQLTYAHELEKIV